MPGIACCARSIDALTLRSNIQLRSSVLDKLGSFIFEEAALLTKISIGPNGKQAFSIS
jgi:hypothetical protein